MRNGSLAALAPAGLAVVESAWLAGDVQPRRRADHGAAGADQRPRAERGSAASCCATWPGPAERSRRSPAARPSGRPASPGDWQRAADEWRKIGNPYEQALELAAGPGTAACIEALDLLDALGAVAAARLVRARLRELGAPRIPRGRLPATQARTRRASPTGRSTCWRCSRPA